MNQPDRAPIGDGEALHALLTDLFPINRSLTGDGVRETLAILGRDIALDVHAVATGTPVLDWEVPREWSIAGATIRAADGTILVDWRTNNLSVVGYSVPIAGVFNRAELAPHIHTLPDQPDLIPYRTAYYAASWGFCLPHSLWSAMGDGPFHVEIDSRLEAGVLDYGECLVTGTSEGEVLVSVHCCHPSLANDNLSGLVVAHALARRQAQAKRRLGYRFLFVPATIGAITWLARNEDRLDRIEAGLVLTCIGDDGPFHYKATRRGGSVTDRAVAHALRLSGLPYETVPFTPYGYDERQYGSPAFDLPVGCLMRAVHGQFSQYHTSADNPDFVKAAALEQSFHLVSRVLDILDANETFERVDGRGEPQLGRRGLYRAISGQKEAGGATQMDLLWVLNLCDGRHSLLDIAERADRPFETILSAAALALDADLIRRVSHVYSAPSPV